MIKVGIIGHTGRLGKPLVRILSKHPYAEIVYVSSRSKPNNLHPSESEAEVFFLALPYGESETKLYGLEGRKVIDLSIDHRCDDRWVYGLPELNREKIENAYRVANPGCYATAILEALLLIKDLIVNIKIKAYSGVSGRPDQPVIKEGGIEQYAKDREHAQVAEIEKHLGKQIESFEPHLVYALDTGIVAVIDAELKGRPLFEGSEFVKLTEFKPFEKNIQYFNRSLRGLKSANCCNISFDVNEDSVRIISSLDNRVKGGSGQAVQNFNLMYGFDETTGLNQQV